jgi:threonyl-tRNA synthetase
VVLLIYFPVNIPPPAPPPNTTPATTPSVIINHPFEPKISSSNRSLWLSWLERFVDIEEVTGSSPVRLTLIESSYHDQLESLMFKQTKDKSLEALRHSTEHVLTQAMLELFPKKLLMAMGPPTDQGFYFDFEPLKNFKASEELFPQIEKKMRQIIKEDLPFIRKELSLDEAKKLFKDNPYKKEWLDQIKDRGEIISVYYTADRFFDLCRGPHLKSTGQIKAFKLLSIAGAYWHGNEKNKMLTRIYGTAFSNPKDLEKYLWQQEEAKKRDHRKLGKDLDLFSFHPQGPGFVFWHPKGYLIYQKLVEYWRKIHTEKNYVEIKTPTLLTIPTWKQSGHMTNFLDKMYLARTGDSKKMEYAIKPMNCDGGMLVYQTNSHSYRELPIRMGELGVVHRYESSGEIHGLMRVREFTQDDAHIYCTPQQVKDELKATIALCQQMYQTCGLPLDHIELSTRPEKSIGSDTVWKKAEDTMRQVLQENDIPHQVNPGDGAFYGPKLDFHLKDCLGRTFQCGTIQLDFAQPDNFDLTYTDQSGQKERPVMIHRTIYGSLERFIGLLIEHFAGAFPVWLSPLQVKVIPITNKQLKYAQKVGKVLKENEIRFQIDDRPSTMQGKIRDAQNEKVPYMLILGPKEAASKNLLVSPRQRDEKNLGPLSLDSFIKLLKKQIETKDLGLIK